VTGEANVLDLDGWSLRRKTKLDNWVHARPDQKREKIALAAVQGRKVEDTTRGQESTSNSWEMIEEIEMTHGN
jgi:hypothetical protein